MLSDIRSSESIRDLKMRVKAYLITESKRIRNEILSALIGKYNLPDLAEELNIDYTTLFKSLSGRKDMGFSFPLAKFGSLCNNFLNIPAQTLLYKEHLPVMLPIVLSKASEILLSMNDRDKKAILRRAEDLLSTSSTNDSFSSDEEYVTFLKERCTIICNDCGSTTPTRNNHKFLQDSSRELSITLNSKGPLSFSTVASFAFKYNVPIDYLLNRDYISLNTITLRSGEEVSDETVRAILTVTEKLDSKDKEDILLLILKNAL